MMVLVSKWGLIFSGHHKKALLRSKAKELMPYGDLLARAQNPRMPRKHQRAF